MRVLENWDVTSLYPNLVRLYGYSSRSQRDKNAYVDLLNLRMKAKKGLLIKQCKGQYTLNPEYFFKGTLSNRSSLKYTLCYNPEE